MAHFTFSTHIDAPQDLVFRIASDIPNAASAISAITGVDMVTEGPVGVGTTWRETREMFGKPHTETLEITAFDPPQSYEVACESCGVLWLSTFRFTPERGGTRVDIETASKPLTWMARIMGFITAPMMRKMMSKCVEGDLRDLKAACEGGAPSAQGQPTPA